MSDGTNDNPLLESRAKAFAESAHEGQFRKYTGQPYFSHPARVAAEVFRMGFQSQMVAAAFLHDVVEDCGVWIETIESEFGLPVASLVFELTNKTKEMKLPRAERKRIDRQFLRYASPQAKIIKLIDRIDNLSEMDGAPQDFKLLYSRESILLADVIGHVHPDLEVRLRSSACAIASTSASPAEARP